MAAIYRTDMTKSVAPATADVSNVARVTAAANASDAQSTAKLLSVFGNVAWEAYTGKQEANLKIELKEAQGDLTKRFEDIKSADLANKAEYERGMAGTQEQQRRDYYGASILAGVNEETARNRTKDLTVSGKQEASVLAEYRNAQEKIMSARDAMPERQHEFMQRSEEILKRYIAKLPGYANNFRQIAEEVTGKRGLDLYSVNRLYEDVAFIEKQKLETQKQRQEEYNRQKTAFVNDAKANGRSELQAVLDFDRLDSRTREDLAKTNALGAQAKANAEAAYKFGGEKLGVYVTSRIAESDTTLLAQQAHVYSELEKLGISRADILNKNIPPNLQDKFKEITSLSGTKLLNLIDAQYNDGVQKLNQKITSGDPIEASAARLALSDWQKWRDDRIKYLSDSKDGPLFAFLGGNPEDTPTKRLSFLTGIQKSFDITPEVVQQLFSGDKATRELAEKRYPEQAKQLRYMERVRNGLLNNVNTDEWMNLIKQTEDYNKNGINSKPDTEEKAAAALISHKGSMSKLTDKVQTNVPISALDVSSVVTKSMATPANMSDYKAGGEKVVDAALAKLSPEDKKTLAATTEQKSLDLVYGVQGFGNDAKAVLGKLVNAPKAGTLSDLNIKPVFVFKDTTGNSSLSVAIKHNVKPNLTMEQQNRFNAYKQSAPNGAEVDKYLTQIDNILAIESKVTGKPITQLRQNFIKTFSQAGMPSDVAVKPMLDAAVAVEGESSAGTQTTTNPNDGAAVLERLRKYKGE